MVLGPVRSLVSARLVGLAPHALVIAVVVFLGLAAGALVGGLLAELPLLRSLSDLFEETLRLTGVVTAVLYALRVAD